MNDWLEISVQADGEAAEAISEVFHRYGRGGAVFEHLVASGSGAHDHTDEMRIKTYIAASDRTTKRKIEEALWHLGQLYPIPDPTFEIITETDWAEAWKAHYTQLHIGQRTVIVPQWQDYQPAAGEIVITLDPGMAFGTGTHPTTKLCLAAMEEVVTPGMAVLDLGTGSGVLAISAAKQGARSVLAVDVDNIAVSSAQENIALNNVTDVVRLQAGSLDQATGMYDLVLVNILAKVILALLDQGLAKVIKPGGTVIAAGIIDEQEAPVRAALDKSGIEVVGRRIEKDWVALIGRKRPT